MFQDRERIVLSTAILPIDLIDFANVRIAGIEMRHVTVGS